VAAVLVPRGPAVALMLDDAQVAEVSEGAKRFPLVATLNGYTWRTSVTRMRGENLLGLNAEVRKGAGVSAGDAVEVEVEVALDEAPREVEIPAVLARAFVAEPEAGAMFAALAYSHRKEFARWVGEAKREETRKRRAEQALALIRAGKTRS
jgi:uncharacterized protein YdeI (YjbR/CyaY-like superfamily)